MTEPLRRAGRGRASDRGLVVWSVSEGRRGRRWREVRSSADGAVVSSLLLELDPDGSFSHAELATQAGLLTLHPERDGTLHGNVITAAGIEHVRGLPWTPESVVLVEGSPVAAAAAAAAAGDGRAHRAIVIGLDLAWRVEERAEPSTALDGRGVPLLADASEWPLEEP